MILLDTHCLVWFAEDVPRLGRRATRLAEAALGRSELCVSAIVFWELAMLASKGRLRLRRAPEAIRLATLERGIREIVVTGEIGIEAAGLSALHGDPADRIIAATALVAGAGLMTADERLLSWRGGAKVIDARH